MSNNLYNILQNFNKLTPKAEETKPAVEKIYESVEAQGSIKSGLESVLAEKYMGFKKTEKAIAKNPKVDNPAAVAASLGREKYGKEKFQKAAAAGKKLGESEMMEKAPPGMEDMVLKLKKQYPGEPAKAFATAWSIYNKKHGKNESVDEAQGRDEIGGAGVAFQQGYQDGKRAKSSGHHPEINVASWGDHITDYRRGYDAASNLPKSTPGRTGVPESGVAEMDTSTLKSYRDKAGKQALDIDAALDQGRFTKKGKNELVNKMVKRDKGVEQADARLASRGIEESAMSEIHAELRDIYDRDDVDAFYKLFSADTPTGQYIQNMANDVVAELGLHPDDDFEKIEEIVWSEIEDMFRNNSKANDMNESAEDRDSYKVAKILFDQGVRYSSGKGDEIVGMIPDALRKMGFNRKIVQWYMGYDEDFISDTIGELILLGKSQGIEEDTCMECGMLENSCGCDHSMNEDYKHKGRHYGGAASEDDADEDDEEDTAPKKRGAPKKTDSERSSASLPKFGDKEYKLPAHKGETRKHSVSDEPPKGTPERAEWEEKNARKEKRAKKIKESNQQFERRFRRIMLSENFKEIMGKHHMTMDEMVKRLSHDIHSYKTHGKMSDVLRDCMEIHSHNPQITDESALGLPGSKNISQLDPGALKPPVTPFEKAKSSVASAFDTKDAWEIPVEPDHELNELARLAGLQVADESTRGEYIKQKDSEAEHSGKHTFHAFGQEFDTDEVTEDDMEEGVGVMHFKAQQAKADGKDSFKMGDKEFPVELDEGNCSDCDCNPCECNEDTALNGEIEKTTGADEVEFSLGEMARLAGIAVEGRDYGDVKIAKPAEFDNSPEEQYMAVDKLIHGGDGEVAGKEKRMQPNKPTFKNGDNPLSPTPVKEETDPLEALGRNLLRAYNSIKLKK